MKKTLLKTCAEPFKCKTNDSVTTPQEFQENKTTKTKQRTLSDKQEKHKKKGKRNSKEEKFETKLLTKLKEEKHILKTLWKVLDNHLQVLNHAYTKKDHNQVKA